MDPNKYPDPKNTSPLQWGWEFLRRNPKYQQLWATEIQSHYNVADLDASWSFAESVRPAGRSRVRTQLSSVKDQFFPTANPSKRLTPFREDFHILTYPPPPSEDKAKLVFDAQFIPYEVGGSTRGKQWAVHRTKGENEIVVWLNLTWPIKQQLANVRKLFESQAKRQESRTANLRRRIEHYRVYLRLLDAKIAGADDKKDCADPLSKSEHHLS